MRPNEEAQRSMAKFWSKSLCHLKPSSHTRVPVSGPFYGTDLCCGLSCIPPTNSYVEVLAPYAPAWRLGEKKSMIIQVSPNPKELMILEEEESPELLALYHLLSMFFDRGKAM